MNPLKMVCAGLGFLFFVLGAIGVVLPILPTTPFLLLAAFFFAKSSDRVDRWFKSTKLYQDHLDSFIKERAMKLSTKVFLCAFASAMLLIAFVLMNNIYGRILIVLVILFKYYYFIFRIRTIKPGEKIPETLDSATEKVAERLDTSERPSFEYTAEQQQTAKSRISQKDRL